MLSIFKKASAVNRGPTTSARKLQGESYTVSQIKARHSANLSAGATNALGLDSVVLPSAINRWMLPGLSWITPDYIQRILSATLMGGSPWQEHALYDLMMQTWPRLVKNVAELKNAVCGLEWNVQSDDTTVEHMSSLAARTRDGMRGDYMVDGKGWRGTVHGLLDGWFCGVVVREVDWEVRGGNGAGVSLAMLPRQTRKVSAEHYGWQKETGKFGLMLPGSDTLADIVAHKFLVGINNSGFGHPCGGALLRSLAWYWCAANFSAEWLLSFAQLFGQPIRWGTYDATQPAMRDMLADMLANMGSATWAAVPAGANLEFKEPAKTGSDNPQKQLIDIADTACDLLILGQTLTSEAGAAGSRALGEVHFNVRSDIIDSAADWVAEILNEQLLTSVATLNSVAGNEDAKLPWYEPGAKVVHDPKARAERIKVIVNDIGLPLSRDYVYEQLEVPVPADGEELFSVQKSQDDKLYPRALALGQMVNTGLPVDKNWAMNFMGIPPVPVDAELLQPKDTNMTAGANPEQTLMARALAGMPVHAREYVMDCIAKEVRQ